MGKQLGEEIKINWDELLKTQAILTKFFKDISSRQELLASDKVTDGRGLSPTNHSHLIATFYLFQQAMNAMLSKKKCRNSDALHNATAK